MSKFDTQYLAYDNWYSKSIENIDFEPKIYCIDVIHPNSSLEAISEYNRNVNKLIHDLTANGVDANDMHFIKHVIGHEVEYEEAKSEDFSSNIALNYQ